ncbi:hypothetical protein HDZ31DRAFT_77043 [Schizophyllum fasciatum]
MEESSRRDRYAAVKELLASQPPYRSVAQLSVPGGCSDFVFGFIYPFAVWFGRWELVIIKSAFVAWICYSFIVPAAFRSSCDALVWQTRTMMCSFPSPLLAIIPIECHSQEQNHSRTPTGELSTQHTKLSGDQSPLASITPAMNRIVGDNPLGLEMVLIQHQVGRVAAQLSTTSSTSSKDMLEILTRFSVEFPAYSDAVHAAMYGGVLSDAKIFRLASSALGVVRSSDPDVISCSAASQASHIIASYVPEFRTLTATLLSHISRVEAARDLGRSLQHSLSQLERLLARDGAVKNFLVVRKESQLWTRFLMRTGYESAELQKLTVALAQHRSVDEVLSEAKIALLSIDVVLDVQLTARSLSKAHGGRCKERGREERTRRQSRRSSSPQTDGTIASQSVYTCGEISDEEVKRKASRMRKGLQSVNGVNKRVPPFI